MSVELPQPDLRVLGELNLAIDPRDKKSGIIPDENAPDEEFKEDLGQRLREIAARRLAEGLPDHGTWDELDVDGGSLVDKHTHD